MTAPGEIGLLAQLACLWEATARKPGNVHRFCDFDDTSYLDFVASAAAIAPVLDAAPGRRVGSTVHECIRRTRLVARANTNLGIVLLLAPLAVVGRGAALRAGVEAVLAALDDDDSRAVYAAIRLAAPGGLGQAPEGDVADEPDRPLRALMALAADRDLIARQYADGYRALFDDAVPALRAGLAHTGCLEGGVIVAHLTLLSRHPDSLIARKRGAAVAAEAAARAAVVLAAGWPETAASRTALTDLDRWLRGDGHARNPGTTADLVAAALFAELLQGAIPLPLSMPWTRPEFGLAGVATSA